MATEPSRLKEESLSNKKRISETVRRSLVVALPVCYVAVCKIAEPSNAITHPPFVPQSLTAGRLADFQSGASGCRDDDVGE